METDLLRKLGSKEITKVQLFQSVESNFGLVPDLIEGTDSSKATVRYGCGKVFMDLSQKYPDILYPYNRQFHKTSRRQAPDFNLERYGNNCRLDES